MTARGLRAAAVALLAAAGVALAGCGADQPPDAGPGGGIRVVQRSFTSRAIGGTEHYAVALPAGYGSGDRRYPVIYALHGLPGNGRSYRHMPIADWARDAAQAGRPAIVVSPQGATASDTDPEWHDWGPGRDWETVVAGELLPRVDRSFRTIPDRGGRAIIGISAGGYGASIIGVRHPATFAVIESWSGYFHPTNPEGDQPLSLGSPDEDEAASVQTYVRDAERFTAAGPTFFGFYVGDADPHFLPENEQLHRELLAAGVPHAYAVYPGAHTDDFWAAHERKWITAAVGVLRPAA
jgi:enterochelin esterase-like enzyme